MQSSDKSSDRYIKIEEAAHKASEAKITGRTRPLRKSASLNKSFVRFARPIKSLFIHASRSHRRMNGFLTTIIFLSVKAVR